VEHTGGSFMYSEPGNTTAQMLQSKSMYCENQWKYFCSRDTHTAWTSKTQNVWHSNTQTHGPVKHKTNDKQPRQINTTGSKKWLLNSVFEARNNEPDRPILQEKTNSKCNNKFMCVYE